MAFPGLSISGFSVAPDAGIVFFALKPFEERTSKDLSGPAITAALNQKLSVIKEAFVLAVPPPSVMGLGTIGGFKLYVEDRADLGYDALYQNMQNVIGKSRATPGLAGTFSGFTVNVPQLDANVDREKAKTQGVPLQNLFETMQIYLGSLYVNDFNRFGRTYEVIAQADAPYRLSAADITRLKTRNDKGEMVPLGAVVKVTETHGPARVMRYNGYPAAEINGGPAPGYSSGQAEALMSKLADENLPRGMTYEWTELTYQRILAGRRGDLYLSALPAAGVLGASRALRKFPPAHRHHPDRADVSIVRHHRRPGLRAATITSSRRSASSCWSVLRVRTRF